jgi:hypothetical protein
MVQNGTLPIGQLFLFDVQVDALKLHVKKTSCTNGARECKFTRLFRCYYKCWISSESNPQNVFASDIIFSDVQRGLPANEQDLLDVFGTEDQAEIANIVSVYNVFVNGYFKRIRLATTLTCFCRFWKAKRKMSEWMGGKIFESKKTDF